MIDESFILSAAQFAARAHEGQFRRYTGEAYINHPREVAALVEMAGGDEFAIAAAWLHDTVEDTAATFEEIQNNFCFLVAAVVRELTKGVGSLNCYRSRMIKVADIISNTKNIREVAPKDARRYLDAKRAQFEEIRQGVPAVLVEMAEEILYREAG